LGPAAYAFAEFLEESRQSFWQTLPLTPVEPDHYSPYLSASVFAGAPLVISPELLVEDGLLTRADIEDHPEFPSDKVSYPEVIAWKTQLLERAFETFYGGAEDPAFREYCEIEAHWLDDYALFRALKPHFGGVPWTLWPWEVRDRRADSMAWHREHLSRAIAKEKFFQWVFSKQWFALKRFCNQRGVRFIGDVPIYAHHDGADVWGNPHLFKLDGAKNPYVVSGVPPDYFSRTGQLWGHPLYRWDVLRETGYDWWIKRLDHALSMYDFVRIDHFRGLVGYWEVPAGETTAINGRWVEAPGDDLLNRLEKRRPFLPIIAEDLGLISADVREVMRQHDLPGMKVLLFAFGADLPTNPYAPHNLDAGCAAYTGTHDNNTVRGWFETEASEEERRRFREYSGRDVTVDEVHWEMIRLLMRSSAGLTIFPMQDVLGLGSEARMNTPATVLGNWEWRMSPDTPCEHTASTLRRLCEIYRRA
jgi:4-alpha-glucanotransferase